MAAHHRNLCMVSSLPLLIIKGCLGLKFSSFTPQNRDNKRFDVHSHVSCVPRDLAATKVVVPQLRSKQIT